MATKTNKKQQKPKQKPKPKLRKSFREMGKGGRYPSKTSVNLCITENRTRQNIISIVLFFLFLVLLTLFVKFVIYRDLDEIRYLESRYNNRISEIVRMREETNDYDRVRAEYSRYGNGYLNEDERSEQDRMEILDIIDRKLQPKEALLGIKIAGNDAVLTINTRKLANVSEVVQNLEEQDIVEYVTVSTSVSGESKRKKVEITEENDVTTQLTIHFRTPKSVLDIRTAEEAKKESAAKKAEKNAGKGAAE